jgi:hypothetical protein
VVTADLSSAADSGSDSLLLRLRQGMQQVIVGADQAMELALLRAAQALVLLADRRSGPPAPRRGVWW